eukprot:2438893-Prymnesium_polylepis.1
MQTQRRRSLEAGGGARSRGGGGAAAHSVIIEYLPLLRLHSATAMKKTIWPSASPGTDEKASTGLGL